MVDMGDNRSTIIRVSFLLITNRSKNMNLQNLNQKFVVSKTALLKKSERQYLQSFVSFKTQFDSDKDLMKDSRKNVLAIIEKSKGNTIAINVDNQAINLFVTPQKRKNVNYKKVIEFIASEYSINKATLDEIVNAHTGYTHYNELTVKGGV
jgi:hypothetical protein|tara:strand:- start:251 stop:703 length:453 start_codon:yes stop_codon:yes gene_type:complete